jgi:probable HAF family extracellular repeat protein
LTIVLALLAALFGPGAAPTGAAAPAYAITDLGLLGGESSSARGINAAGQVGGHTFVGQYLQAFFWQQDREVAPLVPGATDSSASGVNNAGQVVGYAFTPLADDYRAFVWQDGALAHLGTLGGRASAAYAINDAGQIVGSSRTGDATLHAFLWQDGEMFDLGTLGGAESAAAAINATGQVVGYAALADGPRRAALWQEGGVIELGTLGGQHSTAVDINDAGQVVGTASTEFSPTARHAFLWSQESGMADLGTLGGADSSAAAINAAGQVVGRSSTAAGGTSHPFLWQDGAMTDLNALIPADTGWELRRAFDINDIGQIVGDGLIGGETHAFLLTPIPTPPDEGATCSPSWDGTWNILARHARRGVATSDATSSSRVSDSRCAGRRAGNGRSVR